MDVGINSLAYNGLWQVRSDAWSRLEESSSQLSLACAQHRSGASAPTSVTGSTGKALEIAAGARRPQPQTREN